MVTILNLIDAPQYLDQLARWHHSEWSHYHPGENFRQRINRMQSYLNGDFIPTTFIATGNVLLGSAAIIANDMDTRPDLTPWLASVYVRPENRCRGIGSKLVLHLMKQAKNNEIKTLFLFTPDRETFYMKLGWEIINKEYYHDHPVTIMRVNLANN